MKKTTTGAARNGATTNGSATNGALRAFVACLFFFFLIFSKIIDKTEYFHMETTFFQDNVTLR